MLNDPEKNNNRVCPRRGRRCWRRVRRVSGPGSRRVQEGSKSLFNTLGIKTGFVGHFLPYFFSWSNTHHRGHQSQACLLLFTYISRPRQCVSVCVPREFSSLSHGRIGALLPAMLQLLLASTVLALHGPSLDRKIEIKIWFVAQYGRVRRTVKDWKVFGIESSRHPSS